MNRRNSAAEEKLNRAFRIAELLQKQVKRESLDADEQAEINQWLAASENNKVLFEQLKNENQLAFDLLELQDIDTESELVKVRQRLQHTAPRRLVWYAVAATLFVFLSVGIGIYRYQNNEKKSIELTNDVLGDVLPGGNRAILTLADGRTIDLNEMQKGIVMGDDIAYIDGTSVFNERASEKTDNQVYKLTTPRGGTYQITLPDGTHVWLNAESTLRYPNRFTGNERIVELEGEGYFEVKPAEHAIPFRVKTKGQTIDVLGTHFNVSAYDSEITTTTTLVEGSVRVTTSDRQQPQVAVLKPGQQSALRHDGMTVADVDVAPFIAWKSGYFHFKSTPFAEVLTQVSRWYDIELVYEGRVPSQTFSGKMSRNVSLVNVLKLFRGSGVQFRFEQQKLFIE